MLWRDLRSTLVEIPDLCHVGANQIKKTTPRVEPDIQTLEKPVEKLTPIYLKRNEA
jgi:hypothetical protein